MLSFSLLPLLYWSNEIPEYLYKMLWCGRGGKSNDKLNADSSHTNMLVIFVNYSINFSLTTKMNHNEIKKKISLFPVWRCDGLATCSAWPLPSTQCQPPQIIYIYISYHHYFFHMFLYHVHNRKFWVNSQVITKLFHRNTEQFRFLMWYHTHIVQELSAILDLIQSPAAMEKSGGYWL